MMREGAEGWRALYQRLHGRVLATYRNDHALLHRCRGRGRGRGGGLLTLLRGSTSAGEIRSEGTRCL